MNKKQFLLMTFAFLASLVVLTTRLHLSSNNYQILTYGLDTPRVLRLALYWDEFQIIRFESGFRIGLMTLIRIVIHLWPLLPSERLIPLHYSIPLAGVFLWSTLAWYSSKKTTTGALNLVFFCLSFPIAQITDSYFYTATMLPLTYVASIYILRSTNSKRLFLALGTRVLVGFFSFLTYPILSLVLNTFFLGQTLLYSQAPPQQKKTLAFSTLASFYLYFIYFLSIKNVPVSLSEYVERMFSLYATSLSGQHLTFILGIYTALLFTYISLPNKWIKLISLNLSRYSYQVIFLGSFGLFVDLILSRSIHQLGYNLFMRLSKNGVTVPQDASSLWLLLTFIFLLFALLSHRNIITNLGTSISILYLLVVKLPIELLHPLQNERFRYAFFMLMTMGIVTSLPIILKKPTRYIVAPLLLCLLLLNTETTQALFEKAPYHPQLKTYNWFSQLPNATNYIPFSNQMRIDKMADQEKNYSMSFIPSQYNWNRLKHLQRCDYYQCQEQYQDFIHQHQVDYLVIEEESSFSAILETLGSPINTTYPKIVKVSP